MTVMKPIIIMMIIILAIPLLLLAVMTALVILPESRIYLRKGIALAGEQASAIFKATRN